jgi:hypothetical protein
VQIFLKIRETYNYMIEGGREKEMVEDTRWWEENVKSGEG